MATGHEHETESVLSCSTDVSMLRIKCKTLQVSVNSVSGAFGVVQDTFEKLVKETSMLLNEAGSPQFGTSEKACMRQEEIRLRNTLVLMTNNLSALSRCLREHRKGIDKAVDDEGKFITTEPLQIHSPLSPLSENEEAADTDQHSLDYLDDYNDRRRKKRKLDDITEDIENINETRKDHFFVERPAKKLHLDNWINKLPGNIEDIRKQSVADNEFVKPVTEIKDKGEGFWRYAHPKSIYDRIRRRVRTGKIDRGDGKIITWSVKGQLMGFEWNYIGICVDKATGETTTAIKQSSCGATEHSMRDLMGKLAAKGAL